MLIAAHYSRMNRWLTQRMTDIYRTKPFERGPFGELPETPRVPHRLFSDSQRRELELVSIPFGKHHVFYREQGPSGGGAEPLLLVHGLMTTSYSWRYVMGDLAKRYRVIAPDLPGSGDSEKSSDAPYSVAALATWIGEFQRALDIRGCKTVGNSLGGLLCMRLAMDDPGAFSQLVNIHSPFFPQANYQLLHTLLKIPGIKRGLAHVIRKNPLKWVHRNVHYYDESLKSLEEAHAYGDPLAEKNGTEAFIRYLSDVLTPAAFEKISSDAQKLRDAHEPFPVPLLLIYARQDPLVSPKNGERLSKLLPDAKMVWLDDSSHFAHVDTPKLIVDEVLRFLGDS
jgi:pimeloyl-ACP methyl ester carboxylesterase